MQWFGESWGAPVCSTCEHVSIPVGQSCIECGKPIEETDCGFVVPFLSRERRYAEVTFHRACFVGTFGLLRHSR